MTNKQVTESQSGIFGDLIKKFTIALFKGERLKVSLPVRMFEPRSTIERIADGMRYFPIFIKAAANEQDTLQRLKLLLTNMVACLHLSPSPRKPFNPHLGETLEADFEDGTTLSMEHISNHPPITLFQLHGEGFVANGRFEHVASLSTNSVNIEYKGPINI